MRDRRSFAALRAEGRRASRGPVTITFVPSAAVVEGPWAPADLARVAFAIPKRVGNAVVRNRLRRQLRVILAEADPVELAPGAYLVSVRPPAAGMSSPELRQHVHRALTEITRRTTRPTTGDPSVGASGTVGDENPS